MRPAFRSLLLVAVLALGSAGAQTDLGGRPLRVGIDPTVPPFAETAAPGTLRGLDVDVVTALCERIGCDPEFVPTPWDRLLPHVVAGELDLAAAGIWITPEREAVVDFGRPYVVSTHAVVARGADDPPSQADLRSDASLRLGAVVGSTGAQLARELVGDARVRLYVDGRAARRALLDGEVDGVVIEEARAPGWTDAADGAAVVAFGGLAPAPVGLVFGEGSPLVAAFDAGLARLREDGTLDALAARWLGREAGADGER
jgi:polar amino acid transport system substrate-binding protein